MNKHNRPRKATPNFPSKGRMGAMARDTIMIRGRRAFTTGYFHLTKAGERNKGRQRLMAKDKGVQRDGQKVIDMGTDFKSVPPRGMI